MTSLEMWLAAAVAIQSVGIAYLVTSFQTMNRTWTRAFLDKQGIPLHIMDGEPAPPEPERPAAQPPPKHKISIPLPGWRPGGPVRHP